MNEFTLNCKDAPQYPELGTFTSKISECSSTTTPELYTDDTSFTLHDKLELIQSNGNYIVRVKNSADYETSEEYSFAIGIKVTGDVQSWVKIEDSSMLTLKTVVNNNLVLPSDLTSWITHYQITCTGNTPEFYSFSAFSSSQSDCQIKNV